MECCLEQGTGGEQVGRITITEDLNLFLRLARCGLGQLRFHGVGGVHESCAVEPPSMTHGKGQVCTSRTNQGI